MKYLPVILVSCLISIGGFAQRGPAAIITQPTSWSGCSGTNATLSIAVSGTPPFTLHWYRTGPPGCEFCSTELVDDAVYSGARTTNLTINTTSFSAGVYYYYASAEAFRIGGVAYSNTVTVTVYATPSAPYTFGGTSACGPSKVTLNAYGAVNGQFRWYTAATGGSPLSGEYNGSYTTPTISATTTYYVAANNGTCESSRTSIVATINPIPASPGTPGGFSCGPGPVTMTATGATDGSFLWYRPDGTWIRGENSSTYTTPSLSTAATYFVSIFSGSCESSRVPIVASINSIPGAPTVIDGSGCAPSKVSLKATGAIDGQYRWYTATGVLIVGETNGTYITPSIITTTSYIVAISVGGCQGPGRNITALINTPPSPPIGSGNSACGPSASVTLSATGGRGTGDYRWYTNAGVLIAGEVNNTYTTPSLSITTNYLVSIDNGTCESTKTSVTATINTIPPAPTTTGNSACGTSTVLLTASGGANGQYRWYSAAGVLINGETNSTYTTPVISTTTSYLVSINNGTCESTKTPVTATINTIPTAPTTTGNAACGPSTITLSAAGGINGQYRWYSASGIAISGQVNSSFTTSSISSTTSYLVSINNGTCESTKTSVTATINTVPTAPTTTGNSACGTSTVLLNASGGTNGQYRWYTAAGVLINGETNSAYTTPLISTTTNYLVSINNGICEGTKTSVTATINTIPPAPTTTGNSACGASSITLTAAGGTNGQYRWYSAAGVLINGETNSTYTTPVISTTTSYLVSISNGVCESTKTTVTATISGIPTAPTVNGGSSCGPSSIILTANGAGAGQYRWYTSAGALISGETNGTYTTTLLSTTTNYSVSINNGCESAKISVTATINTIPSAPTTTGNSACGTSSVSLNASGGTPGQYRWYDLSNVLIAGQNNSTYTTPAISSTTTYLVAINNGTCESSKTPVTATVLTLPAAPITTGNSACGPSATITLIASGGGGGQYRWYTSTGGLIAGETASSYTTSSIAVTTTYSVAINNGTCESTKTAVTATIINPPTQPSIPGNSGCGTTSITLTASGGSAGQYRWYTQSAGGSPISGETNNVFVTPVISVSTTYYSSIDNGICESPRTPVTATINTPPSPPTTTNGSRCSPGTVTITASGGSAGQFRWYTVATGGSPISGEVNSSYTTPFISVSTAYYVTINNGTCESTRVSVLGQINSPSSAPGITGGVSCGPGAVILSASGGSNGEYRWYAQATGGSPISGETSNIYTTPTISVTTTYYVAINNGTCESGRSSVVAQINSVPSSPVASGVSGCSGSAITISASGGSAGQYRWYTTPSGGTAVAGQTNSTFAPVVTVTTTFYVSINNGTCESVRRPVVVTTNTCNQPPVIEPENTEVAPGGIVTIDLLTLVSDPDNNLDLSTLRVLIQPFSGARASIDGNSVLTLDYQGVTFIGTDRLTVQVCDLLRSCAQKEFTVEVQGGLIIYSGMSPNGDGKNDLWIIQGIEVLDETRANHVSIFNRWGDSIYETDNYDNGAHVFGGKNNIGQDVPAGTYFYKIVYTSGRKTDNGYFTLKR